jgi:hypothetical protein
MELIGMEIQLPLILHVDTVGDKGNWVVHMTWHTKLQFCLHPIMMKIQYRDVDQWSEVGRLLYCVEHSRPDMLTADRELS